MEKLEKFQILASCLIITFGLLIASLIFANKISKDENITVTGSASKIVKSDSAKLGFSIRARKANQKESFAYLKTQTPLVIEYLKSKGINEIDIKSMNGYNIYRQNEKGYSTNEIIAYEGSQHIEIKSNDVSKIKRISTDIQNLINKGINIEVYSPEYFYSDLASIKVDLLKEASQDAKQRASSMLSATGANVGKVKSMRMGVFQITPVDSNMVSDMGINDTTSIDKKVTAVANVVFKVK
ncbi:MAG: SIMPL domain-containing protein [Candidatus Gastranaerophilales bacterium]|nr:SIMPL domain-containing protein [Candidatus Gastranaerophilales bacterium]